MVSSDLTENIFWKKSVPPPPARLHTAESIAKHKNDEFWRIFAIKYIRISRTRKVGWHALTTIPVWVNVRNFKCTYLGAPMEFGDKSGCFSRLQTQGFLMAWKLRVFQKVFQVISSRLTNLSKIGKSCDRVLWICSKAFAYVVLPKINSLLQFVCFAPPYNVIILLSCRHVHTSKICLSFLCKIEQTKN